jgi:hypothetical protein
MTEIEKMLSGLSEDPKVIDLLVRYVKQYTDNKPPEMETKTFVDILASSVYILSKLNPDDVELTNDDLEKTSFISVNGQDFGEMQSDVIEGYITNVVNTTVLNELMHKKIRVKTLIERVALLHKNIFGKIIVYSRVEFI